MMKKQMKRFIAALMVACTTMMLTACGGQDPSEDVQSAASSDKQSESSAQAESEAGSEEVVTLSFYPANGSISSGVVSGYLGDFFKEEGLAIEVWSYSEDKTNAILASGELPDIMYVTAEQLTEMIGSDMILQLDEYLDDVPHIVEHSDQLDPAFNFIREYRSNGTGNVYAFPTNVGPTAMSNDTSDRNVIKLYWDAYEAIGAPAINSYDDYIDVAKQMMEAYPVDKDGNPTWGIYLNSGSDETYWGNIILWMRWRGYTELHLPYLVEGDMVNGTASSILEDNSMYYQGLKFYFDAMQAGIIDPDSINMDRSTAGARTRMVSGGTQPGWRDGLYEYLIPGEKVYCNPDTLYGDTTYGDTNQYIVINKNTKNLEACLKLMDIFADADKQIIKLGAGPEGDMYTITEDGHLYLTEKAKEYFRASSGEPYVLDNGEELDQWKTNYILGGETSYLGYDEKPVNAMHTVWNEELEITSNTDNYNSWKEITGYESWRDCLDKNNAEVTDSDLDYIQSFLTMPDDSMQLTVDAINSIVVEASWNMVYAADEAEFNSIWEQMKADCEGLGAQEVIDWRLQDIENAKAIRDSLR